MPWHLLLGWLTTRFLPSSASQQACLGIIVDGSPDRDSLTACHLFGRTDFRRPNVLSADRTTPAAGTRCCMDTYRGHIRGVSFCPGRHDTPHGTDSCEWVAFAVARHRCESNGYRLCTQAEVLRGDVAGSGCSFDTTYVWVSDVFNCTDASHPELPLSPASLHSLPATTTLSSSPNRRASLIPRSNSTSALASHSLLSTLSNTRHSLDSPSPPLLSGDAAFSSSSARRFLIDADTYTPTEVPSHLPSPRPTHRPTARPTSQPTYEPTWRPTSHPSYMPTPLPTYAPSPAPTKEPTLSPTGLPSNQPTPQPTHHPTSNPTESPTLEPSPAPTPSPTSSPQPEPTALPTSLPTLLPTTLPTPAPTRSPTPVPTQMPSSLPTHEPSSVPTHLPTQVPSPVPTPAPSSVPTHLPTQLPSSVPTPAPSSLPTHLPSPVPSSVPTHLPSPVPSSAPTQTPSLVPTHVPMPVPTQVPTSVPTHVPSQRPTQAPTPGPTSSPTFIPTSSPTALPTQFPTPTPTQQPTSQPTSTPTLCPTPSPTVSCERYLQSSSRRPPALEFAIFADTLDYVQIFLDPPANISAWIGLEFACDAVLDFMDADVATCSFADTRTVNAIVTETSLLAGDIIVLHPGILKQNCEAGARCECDQFANGTSTVLQDPQSPVTPVLILSYPSIASACNSLRIDASRTTGSGGRPMSFTWFVAAESSLILFDIAERAADVDSLTFSSDELLQLLDLFYEANANQTTIDLTVRVEAYNFHGISAVPGNVTVQITSVAVPELISEVQDGLELSTAAGLDITSYAKVTDCADRPLPQRNINWTSVILEETSDRRRLQETSNLSSMSSDPRRFQVAPHTLLPGANYTLFITAADAILGLSGSANISVRVVRSALSAVISGGNRLVTVGSNISISAAESRDPDVASASGAMAGLTFSWSALPNGVIEPGTSDESLNVQFEVAGTYIFIVTVTSADGRNATTSAVYTVIDLESFLPTVTISSATRVSNGLRVILGGSIELPRGDNSTMMRSTWSVEPSFVAGRRPLSAVATTAISIIGNAQRIRRHDLVLPAGSLATDTAYNFRLEAAPFIEADEEIETSLPATFASVSITVSRRPTPGKIAVSPNNGVALQTSFTLSTSRWTSSEPPLKFFFESIVNASTQRLSPAAFSNVLRNTWLPAGNPNVTLVAVATDALGGRGRTTTSVLCLPNNLSTDELATTTDALLVEATGSFSLEGLAQLVVAASGSAASDANLTDTLVTQLFSASETQDDDFERVELSSGALASAANDPTLLDDGTAMNALMASRNLAQKSLRDGITEATADSLSQTLSNILNTSLFGDSDSSDRSSTQNSSQELTESIDTICRSQLVGTVEGENAQVLDTANIKSASSRYSRSSADGAPRTLGVSTGAAAELPNELGASESGYEAWFASFSTNVHDAEVGGDNATSPTLRFGLSSPENDSVAVIFNLATHSPQSGMHNTSSRVNLTCDCGFYGNVTHLCPDGTVLSYACEGVDATFEVICPSVDTGCLSWNVATKQWTGDDCEVVATDDGSLKCACDIQPTGTALDISSRTSLTGSLSAYASSLRAKPNFGAAFEVFLTIASLLAVCSTLALIARRLDKRDAEFVEKGMHPPTVGEVSVSSVSDIKEEGAAEGSRSSMNNLPRHEVMISGRQWPRFVSALKLTHPFLVWFYVYDNVTTRTSRVWMKIGVEVLTFFFALAIENNLFYPDPGCSNQDSQIDCLDFPKAAKWMPGGGHDMCEWDQCSETCTPYLPNDTEGTKPANLLTVCIVIVITMPLLRLFDWLHESYLGGQFPIEIKNLCTSSSSGSPPSSEGDAKSGNEWAHFGQATETDGSSQLDERAEVIPPRATPLDVSQNMPTRNLGTGADDNSVEVRTRVARHDYDKESGGQPSLVPTSMARLAVDDEADIKQAAMRAAPDVAASVEQQGAELSTYIHELENRNDPESRKAVRLLRRLREENLRQWGYSANNRDEFIKQVSLRLEREMQLSLRWHSELFEIRHAYDADDAAYYHLARRRLLEYDYVLQLTSLERQLYYSSLNRVETNLDPPQRPALKPYLAAVVAIVAVVAIEIWYLLQTAFLMGKRRSRLWLIDALVTLGVVYGIMVPSGTFFFMVWVPTLFASHVSRHRQQSAKKFPYSTITPNAMTILLARHPELQMVDEVNPAQTTIQGETLYLPVIVANISEYINAELWKPPPDTRLLIIFVGLYSFFPEDIQSTLFEEAVCFTPFLSSQIMASAKYRAKGVDFLLTLVASYFLLFIAFIFIEGIRLLIRKSYLKFHTDPTVRQLIW